MTPKLHVKRGDKVEIIAGKDKGKTGNIIQAFPKDGKVVVKGCNMATKHRKARKQGEVGEIIQVEAPINISNVLLFCSKCNKGVRHGYEGEKAEKTRVCKKCGSKLG